MEAVWVPGRQAVGSIYGAVSDDIGTPRRVDTGRVEQEKTIHHQRGNDRWTERFHPTSLSKDNQPSGRLGQSGIRPGPRPHCLGKA